MILNKIVTLAVIVATTSVAWDYRTIIKNWLSP